MNLEKLPLSIPQRSLMDIFSRAKSIGDYDDQCVRALLTYLQKLLAEAGSSSPTLDRMLAGTLPPLDFERFYDGVMREVNGCGPEEYGVPPSELPLKDYRDALLNCFPKIFLDLYPEPVKVIDPAANLLVTWRMWYGDKVREELFCVYDDELKAVLSLIYEYIWVCTSGWPGGYQIFLSNWTQYLLTREWPDNQARYEESLRQERELRKHMEKTLFAVMQEKQELEAAMEEHFITVTDAARAVLRIAYGRDDVTKEADAWRKRITDGGIALGEAVLGKQGRKYYCVRKVIKAFQTTNLEELSDGEIADAITARSLPRSKMEDQTRRRPGEQK